MPTTATDSDNARGSYPKSLLSSDLIRFRAVEPEDADVMFKAEKDEANFIYNGFAAPYSAKQLLDYALSYDADPLRAGQLRLVIESTDCKPSIIGLLDLTEISPRDSRAFVGIYILPMFRRKGYAEEALTLGANYAEKILGIRHLAAKITNDNLSSIHLFEKSGWIRTATIPKWVYCPLRGENIDMHIYLHPHFGN